MSSQPSLRELTQLLLEAIREQNCCHHHDQQTRLLAHILQTEQQIFQEQKTQTRLLLGILAGLSGGSVVAGTPGKPAVVVGPANP